MIRAKQRRATRSALLLATVVAVVLAAGPVMAADEDVTFEGAGWGHGVGMSQWGAYAQATAGRSYQQILPFYYVDTSIQSYDAISPGHPDLKVNLEGDRTDLMLRVLKTGSAAQVPATITRGSDIIALTSNQSVRLVWAGPNQCTFEFREGSDLATAPFATWAAGSCLADIVWDGDVDAPTTMIEITGCFLYDWNSGSSRACRYTRGSLQTIDNIGRDSDPGVDLVLDVDIDAYVLGISEVSYFWPAEALKAQAVAARSYAAEAIDRLNPASRACACDVLDTAGDQRYVGYGHGIQQWIDAVNATDNQVLTHPAAPRNHIVATFYSSSNGGATEARHEKWGGSPTPWLPSVPDPWSLQPPNPRASWTISMNPATLATKVWGANPPALASVRVTERNTSGSAKTVEFRAGNGAVTTRSSAWVTSAVGLYSWYFDVDYVVGPPVNAKATMRDQVALQDPRSGVWHLRYGDGRVDSYYYGNPKDTPYAGDWNGDGIDTMGLYRESTGFLFLRNTNSQGVADVSIYYGNPGDKPIAGDWNGDGIDTVGIYRPSQSKFYLRNSNTQGVADIDFAFGQPGDVPLAGDWNGDGIDTVGIYRPANKTVYLLNDFADVAPDVVFVYSGTAAGDRVIVGDWNGDGIDTLGVFRPSTGTFYLRDSFTQSSANIVFAYGESHMNPVAGDWGG